MGYHDGFRGAFPASAISLDLPGSEDIVMDAQSTLVATAKWEFKPKDAHDGGWIRFSKGDKISCVGYRCVDAWVWSGKTDRGKWGLFPSAFVEGLRESREVGLATSPGRMGFGMRIGSFEIGRRRGTRSGEEAFRGFDGGREISQAGLEVASSGSSWRGGRG